MWRTIVGMANIDEIDSTILGLPTEERARLARLLLLSLDEQIDDGVEEAWRVEAEKRYAEYCAGKVQAIDGHEAMREARQTIR